ncbi:MAG TPA: hypothetical protein VL484_18275 [Vicinamibacterales bacterium]|nr:hypothetical protein [Vicinamibacterales bacterium]
MKGKAVVLPAWVQDEWDLLGYLTSAHEGHQYAEELLEGISLLASWTLVGISIIAVFAVVVDAFLR